MRIYSYEEITNIINFDERFYVELDVKSGDYLIRYKSGKKITVRKDGKLGIDFDNGHIWPILPTAMMSPFQKLREAHRLSKNLFIITDDVKSVIITPYTGGEKTGKYFFITQRKKYHRVFGKILVIQEIFLYKPKFNEALKELQKYLENPNTFFVSDKESVWNPEHIGF